MVAMPAKRILGLTLVLLAACAEKPWLREGASAEQRLADQRACEGEAYQAVSKRMMARSSASPAQIEDSLGRRFNVYPRGPFADQFGTQLQEEARLTSECMRAKGYEQK